MSSNSVLRSRIPEKHCREEYQGHPIPNQQKKPPKDPRHKKHLQRIEHTADVNRSSVKDYQQIEERG